MSGHVYHRRELLRHGAAVGDDFTGSTIRIETGRELVPGLG